MSIRKLNSNREGLANIRDIIIQSMKEISDVLRALQLHEAVIKDVEIQGKVIVSNINKQINKIDQILVRELLRYVENDENDLGNNKEEDNCEG